MLLGDWIAKISTDLGMKTCVPCQKRQAAMNQAHLNIKTKLKDFFFTTPQQSPPSQPPSEPQS